MLEVRKECRVKMEHQMSKRAWQVTEALVSSPVKWELQQACCRVMNQSNTWEPFGVMSYQACFVTRFTYSLGPRPSAAYSRYVI